MAITQTALAEDEVSISFFFEGGTPLPTAAVGQMLIDLDRVASQTLGTAAHVEIIAIETGSLRVKFKVTPAWASVGVAIAALVPAYATYFASAPDPVLIIVEASHTQHIHIDSVFVNEAIDMGPEKASQNSAVEDGTTVRLRVPEDLDGQNLGDAIRHRRAIRLRGKFYTRGPYTMFVSDGGIDFYVDEGITNFKPYLQDMHFEVTGTPKFHNGKFWLDLSEIV